MKHKVKIGDVFLIPIDDSRWGIGQVVGNWKGELYIVVFDSVYNRHEVAADSALEARPLLAALSLDAKIYHGYWPVVGNVASNLNSIPQPVFKVNQDGVAYVESRDRLATRPATALEAESLRFRTVVAPVRLEKALRAHFGVGIWEPKYDELLYRYALESSQVVVA